MNIEFDVKTSDYSRVRDQLVTNHEFLQRWYLDMQRKLNDKYKLVKAERAQWEIERTEIAGMAGNLDSEVVALNVGGTAHLMTERDVLRLCPESTLAKMFSGMHELKKIDDEVFLDRDGATFQHLVNYLRNDREVLPEFADRNDEIHFYKELDFWKVPLKHTQKRPQNFQTHRGSAAAEIQQSVNLSHNATHNVNAMHNITTTSVQRKTVAVNHTQGLSLGAPSKIPASLLVEDFGEQSADGNGEDSQGVALKAAKDKWNELGPLRLEDIVQNSQEPIDQSMKFGQSAYNKYIIGQLGSNSKVTGVGKEINHIIYEGQFIDDVYNGYGRFIYSNGNYYIGQWLDGKRSGYGKLVDKTGRVYEGQWQYSKYMGS